MSLASQKNLFGIDEPIPKNKKNIQSPIDKMHQAEVKAINDIIHTQPVLAELTNRVFEDFGAKLSPGDSELWLQLFTDADKVNTELAAILMYVRGTGAVLVPSLKFGHIIKPIIREDAWPSIEQYNHEKQCLAPYRSELLNLLKNLNRKRR